MSISTQPPAGALPRKPIVYPESDGAPIAENTLQFRWIVTIKENLDLTFAETVDVFVAGDLFWYPVEGRPDIRVAPDVMAAFGRPKGDRGSYLQWLEGGIAPHVVFEIQSPGNRPGEMMLKFRFYDRYGVEEYYLYNPDNGDLTGFIRVNGSLEEIPNMRGWVSPRLQCRFDIVNDELEITGPVGNKFLTVLELGQKAKAAETTAEALRQQLRNAGIEPQA